VVEKVSGIFISVHCHHMIHPAFTSMITFVKKNGEEEVSHFTISLLVLQYQESN
jgi:hypothetical protein